MLSGLGRAARSGWPRGGRQPPALLCGRAARGRRGGSPLPSAPQFSIEQKLRFLMRFLFAYAALRKIRGFHVTSYTEIAKSRLPVSVLQVRLWKHTGAWREPVGAPYRALVPSDEVTIDYRHGLPMITLTLPTRSERCQFTIKPMVTTVEAFLQDVQREDKGVERAEVFATDGCKVCGATSMEVLLRNDFTLVINNIAYCVSPPVKDKLSSEHATEMEDIKSLVHRLYVALHLEDHQVRKERELLRKLDHLKEELLPLEQMKARIAINANAKTTRLLWIGLALMSTQGGALAWLTWWVYSWDIMEPVTYFITYGSAMAFYAYFILTKQDYIYSDARDRQFLHYFYRKCKKQHFNVERYNQLKENIAEAEESLKRLRQTLQLRLPVQEIKDKD